MFRRLQDRMLGKSKSVVGSVVPPPPPSPTDAAYIVPNSPDSPLSFARSSLRSYVGSPVRSPVGSPVRTPAHLSRAASPVPTPNYAAIPLPLSPTHAAPAPLHDPLRFANVAPPEMLSPARVALPYSSPASPSEHAGFFPHLITPLPESPREVGFIAQHSDYSSEEDMMPLTEENLKSILAETKNEIDYRNLLRRKKFARAFPDQNPKNFLIRKGIQNSSVISNILNGTLDIGGICLYSNRRSFVAVLNQGKALYGWGDQDFGAMVPLVPQERRIKRIYASNGAYAALFRDGTCICWGDANYGGVMPFIHPERTIEKMCSSSFGFSALLDDGSLIQWGQIARGDLYNTKLNIPKEQTVKELYAGYDYIIAHLNNGAIVYGERTGGPTITVPGTSVLSICPGICVYAVIFKNGSIMYGGSGSYRVANKGPKSFIPPGKLIKEWYFTPDCFIVILDDKSILCDWIIEEHYRYPLAEKIFPSLKIAKSIYFTQVSICVLFCDGKILFEPHARSTRGVGPWRDQIYPSIPLGRTAVNIYANDGAYVVHLDNQKIVCFGTREYGGITPEISPERTILSICPGGSSFSAVLDNGEIIHWGSILLTRINIFALQPVNEMIRIPAGCQLGR